MSKKIKRTHNLIRKTLSFVIMIEVLFLFFVNFNVSIIFKITYQLKLKISHTLVSPYYTCTELTKKISLKTKRQNIFPIFKKVKF